MINMHVSTLLLLMLLWFIVTARKVTILQQEHRWVLISLSVAVCRWRYHYCPLLMAGSTPDLQLPSRITPLTIYTARWQEAQAYEQLAKGCTRKHSSRELNSQHVDAPKPLRHRARHLLSVLLWLLCIFYLRQEGHIFIGILSVC